MLIRDIGGYLHWESKIGVVEFSLEIFWEGRIVLGLRFLFLGQACFSLKHKHPMPVQPGLAAASQPSQRETGRKSQVGNRTLFRLIHVRQLIWSCIVRGQHSHSYLLCEQVTSFFNGHVSGPVRGVVMKRHCRSPNTEVFSNSFQANLLNICSRSYGTLSPIKDESRPYPMSDRTGRQEAVPRLVFCDRGEMGSKGWRARS